MTRMQLVPAVALPAVRPPWPDEMSRLQNFLPLAFRLGDGPPHLGVTVQGATERMTGAFGLRAAGSDDARDARLCLRVAEVPGRLVLLEALARRALALAREEGVASVTLQQALDIDTPDAGVLRGLGFVEHERQEVYHCSLTTVLARLDPLHRRLLAGLGRLPAGVELTRLLPDMADTARRFLEENMPEGQPALEAEQHVGGVPLSMVLWLNGQIKGLLLFERDGTVGHCRLRVVARELRGGWANLCLLHAGVRAARDSGAVWARFELNPARHEETQRLARSLDATLVEHLALLRWRCLGSSQGDGAGSFDSETQR